MDKLLKVMQSVTTFILGNPTKNKIKRGRPKKKRGGRK